MGQTQKKTANASSKSDILDDDELKGKTFKQPLLFSDGKGGTFTVKPTDPDFEIFLKQMKIKVF